MTQVGSLDARWVGAALGLSAVGGLVVALAPAQVALVLPLCLAFTVVLFRPTWALPLLFGALMLSGAGFVVGRTPVIVVPMTLAKLGAVVVLAAWLTRSAFAARQRIAPTPIAWALGCAALALLGGLAWSTDPRHGLDLALGFSLLAGLCLVLNQLVDLRRLRPALVATGWVYVCVLAASLALAWWAPSGGGRFTGFSLNPNEWALMVVVPLCPFIAIFRAERGWVAALGIGAAVLLAGASVVATESRAGLVALIACAPVIAWIAGRRLALAGAGLVVVAAVVAALTVDLSSLTDRLAALVAGGLMELDGSVRDRAIAQRVAWQAFVDAPWLGIGAGAFDDRSLVLSGGQIDIGTHNTYLQILAELGLVGAAAFATVPIAVVGTIVGVLRRAPGPLLRGLAIGLLGSAVSVGVLMFSATLLTQAVPFFCLAVLLIAARASRLPSQKLSAWKLT